MRKPNTFILFWNPQFSNVKDEDRSGFVEYLCTGGCYTTSWAIGDWEKVREGDRFFRVRCGMPNPADDGVIDSGYIVSKPFAGTDWSGKGRKVYYADLDFDVVLDYDTCPILTSNKLDLRIPNFDWHGGNSGRLLLKKDAAVLEKLWQQLVDGLIENPETYNSVFRIFKQYD